MLEPVTSRWQSAVMLLGFGLLAAGGLVTSPLLAWPFLLDTVLTESQARLIWCLPGSLGALGVVMITLSANKRRVSRKGRAAAILVGCGVMALLTSWIQHSLFSEADSNGYSAVATMTSYIPGLRERYAQHYQDGKLTAWEAMMITADGENIQRQRERAAKRQRNETELSSSKSRAFEAAKSQL
ncbi:MAG: hypothetical protein CVV05_01510 [Gammaproteobacteria bacterium HGW-Gammaproteobacteria-1]|nr:MAG: hypothetical protein CVV05_01510 [Gammaproteobacteria bacterium HGW-Gammaproteobacteria-1]